MAIRIFVLLLLTIATISYFIPVENRNKKDVENDIPLLTFDDSVMYTLTPQSMNRIVYSQKAIRYKNRDVLEKGKLTLRSIDAKNTQITDTLWADLIVKRGDNFKFLNNVKFTRNDYVTLNTDELFYDAKKRIATNTLPFDGNYFKNYIKGENIYLDLNKYYMKAKKTHFEIDTKQGK